MRIEFRHLMVFRFGASLDAVDDQEIKQGFTARVEPYHQRLPVRASDTWRRSSSAKQASRCRKKFETFGCTQTVSSMPCPMIPYMNDTLRENRSSFGIPVTMHEE
ncbi:hypothetical protein N6L27_13175 [Leisingera sp. SS27]|uniref:hypothetical protein n=1 Tax=Leisingera sp. SS27 TaxID=2979462 RepID=UPI00232F18D7|nr:hypothetical protein [Leisingera sp. SS27]MDC0658953.1 hypothetical protein [Leisingera sp. SS27]